MVSRGVRIHPLHYEYLRDGGDFSSPAATIRPMVSLLPFLRPYSAKSIQGLRKRSPSLLVLGLGFEPNYFCKEAGIKPLTRDSSQAWLLLHGLSSPSMKKFLVDYRYRQVVGSWLHVHPHKYRPQDQRCSSSTRTRTWTAMGLELEIFTSYIRRVCLLKICHASPVCATKRVHEWVSAGQNITWNIKYLVGMDNVRGSTIYKSKWRSMRAMRVYIIDASRRTHAT